MENIYTENCKQKEVHRSGTEPQSRNILRPKKKELSKVQFCVIGTEKQT